jgi:hypothetical protein
LSSFAEGGGPAVVAFAVAVALAFAVILSEGPERAVGQSNGAKSKDPEELTRHDP